MNPSVTDRICSVFTDANPELLETVTRTVTETLQEIPTDQLDVESVKDLIKSSLIPLVTEKFTDMMGVPATDLLESYIHSWFTRLYVDPVISSQLRKSWYLSDVKFNLIKRGIRIYF